jgi:hypothetical protein
MGFCEVCLRMSAWPEVVIREDNASNKDTSGLGAVLAPGSPACYTWLNDGYVMIREQRLPQVVFAYG